MADITINLRADPSGFESGVKAAEKAIEEWEDTSGDSAADVAKKLEQVIRTLVKLGTESGKTKDDMVSDLRTFGLSAEQAERAVQSVWDEMGEGQRVAADVEKASDALNGVKDAAGDVGGKVGELGGIVNDVLSGDFGSAAESAIGALASIGAFAGAGGALAGVLAGGLVQTVGQWIGEWSKAAEEVKQRFAQAYRAAAEEGRIFLDEAQIQAASLDILQEQGTEGRKRAMEEARTAGVEYLTVIRAQAGDQEALNAILDLTRQKEEEVLAARSSSNGTGEQRITENDIQLIQLQQIIGKYEEQLGVQEANEQVARDMITLQEESAAKDAENNAAAKRGIDEQGKRLQALADQIASIPNPVLTPRLDTSGAERDLQRFASRPPLRVGVELFYKNPPGGRELLR